VFRVADEETWKEGLKFIWAERTPIRYVVFAALSVPPIIEGTHQLRLGLCDI
jgi:hypothetical protein